MSQISLLIDEPASTTIATTSEQHESYSELVWKKFKKSKAAIAGGLMILVLAILAIRAVVNTQTTALFNQAGTKVGEASTALGTYAVQAR